MIFRRTKREIVAENPKWGITEIFGRIQRGDHSNLHGKWRHGTRGITKVIKCYWGGDHFSEVTFKGGISLQCRHILGGRNLVRVRNIVVAAIFDFMTVGDWGG